MIKWFGLFVYRLRLKASVSLKKITDNTCEGNDAKEVQDVWKSEGICLNGRLLYFLVFLNGWGDKVLNLSLINVNK